MERLPVPGGFAGAALDDEMVRLLRVLNVVLEHPQDGLLPPTLTSQGLTAARLDSLLDRGLDTFAMRLFG